MTKLRRMMLEELQRRNYSKQTIRYYLQAVADFARHCGRSPDKLGLNELRSYQAYLLRDRQLAVGTVVGLVAALRFFFNKTLQRHLPPTDIPYPKHPRRLPAVLSVEEVARLIDSARNLLDRTLLMVLYSTGMRNCELRHLQVQEIDSKSMLIPIQRGKGGRDRYVPLSPKLLETLREYYRWMKPKTWLFPGTLHNWRADKPLTPKVVGDACQFAARRAGIKKRVYAHLLRHYLPFLTMSCNCSAA
jgi:integrase/recombinase XerD